MGPWGWSVCGFQFDTSRHVASYGVAREPTLCFFLDNFTSFNIFLSLFLQITLTRAGVAVQGTPPLVILLYPPVCTSAYSVTVFHCSELLLAYEYTLCDCPVNSNRGQFLIGLHGIYGSVKKRDAC